MRSDVLIYLSGPITPRDGYCAEENAIAGLKVHLQLLRMGIPNLCPQMAGAFPSAWTEVPWDLWMHYDLALIDRCTHLLMLPRWEDSKGARLEQAYAREKHLPILYSVEEVIRVVEQAA